MRQGRPWVVYGRRCREGEHLACLHRNVDESSHCSYTTYCACDCHPRDSSDPPELLKLRADLAAKGEITGEHQGAAAIATTVAFPAAAPKRRRRRNPLRELIEVGPGRPRGQQQVLLHDRRATSVACDRHWNHAKRSPVETTTRVSKALECQGCNEKRQVVEWMGTAYYGKAHAKWRLCAICLLAALQALLKKQITRKHREEGESDDDTPTRSGAVAPGPLLRQPTARAVRRPRRTLKVQRANRRARRPRNRRRT